MNELTTWNYNSSEVRTIEKNGEPWWVLAKALGTTCEELLAEENVL
ncbi:MAG: hypothetical protein J6B75_02025 [Ruminococcus sp.]|nr:hypothetical protein [Ruminococcus sp.]